jgi:hypothetical protein
MILEAYAVINPVTMMIESFYALATCVTMLGPRCHDHFALCTYFPKVHMFNDIL